MKRAALLAVLCAAGCYAGAPAARDVNEAWRGRTRAELEGRWGRPAAAVEQGRTTSLQWLRTRVHVTLPSARAELTVAPGMVDASAEITPGEIWTSSSDVRATVDGGVVTSVQGPSLHWGAPNDANLRWGTVLGLHAGLGRLDDTSTPLPSGGAYLGGMLGPTLALVGCFSLASGTGDAGSAMGFAGGVALQWWPATRVWLRAGPALVLAFDPGFEDPAFSLGPAAGASVALVKVGSFVLDLRLDVTVTASVTLGTAGIGVNLN